ncbi:MAG TPA: HEAT repeat domain-containing protein, partial [Xanthomonadaceae bacterium]|nr:HEAT repeat domain-containing protein [Xanthomonadaceae bacterium]
MICLLPWPGLVLAQASPPAGGNATVERARALLDQALIARNPDTRKAAVEALGLIGPREPYMSRLMVMLDDKDVDVRVAAIASLVDLHDRDALPAIRRAYDDPIPEVSFAAAKALLAMDDPTGRDAMVDVLGGGDDTASGYMATNGRMVARMFYAPRTAIPFLVARTIGIAHVAGLGAGVASLEGLLTDQNISGRATAALLLGADKDPRVVPALRKALHDKDTTVRAAAVHALTLRDDVALEQDLLPLLDDRKDEVRTRAAAGCLRLELIASDAQARIAA